MMPVLVLRFVWFLEENFAKKIKKAYNLIMQIESNPKTRSFLSSYEVF